MAKWNREAEDGGQAWRLKTWPEGLYSIVAFELEVNGSGTRLALTPTASRTRSARF